MRIIFALALVTLAASVLTACTHSSSFGTQKSALDRPFQGGTAHRERGD